MTQRNLVVGNILATAAIRYPHAPAIYCSTTNRRYTFGDVDNRANRLANALLHLGFKKGDVVAFLSSNRSEMVEIYFALARTGIVGLPLNYRLAPIEMLDLTRAMGAVGLIYENKFMEFAKQAAGRVRHVIQFGATCPSFALDYDSLLASATDRLVDSDILDSDPFYFNLTSGTTGMPKSYILTQRNNCALDSLFRSFDMSRHDVAMTVFPAFGRVGFAWIAGAMLYGIPNVLANFEADDVLRLIATERVTIFNLVPTMAALLLSAQATAHRDLKSVRAIVFAGAMLPKTIRDQTMEELCPNIYEYYGMQESGALVVSSPEDRKKNADSVGKPITFSQVRIVDQSGKQVPTDAIGEIIGRSPSAASSYFDNAEKSLETFREGWIHTGDLGSVDGDGYLTIRGRKKDMIVTGGQNVHAAEVEEIILRYPGVTDCAVFGLPDDLWGERVTALVISAGAFESNKLNEHCRHYLAGFKVPKEFIIESGLLPRTPTGKVQKFQLVERFRRRDLSATNNCGKDTKS